MYRIIRFLKIRFDTLLDFIIINLTVLVLVIILFHRMLFSGGYIISGDLSLPLFPAQFNAYFWPLWNSYQNADVTYSLLYLAYPSKFLAYILVKAGLMSVPTSERLYIVLPFFIGGNSFYFLIKELLTRYKFKRVTVLLSGTLAGIIFLTNPASLNLLLQEGTMFETMTLLPLLILLLRKTYTNGSSLSILGASLVCAMCFTGPHSILIWLIVVIFSFLPYVNVRNAKRLVYILILSALYSAFWILPVLFGSKGGPASAGFIVSKLFIQGKNIMDTFTGLAWYSIPPLNYALPYNVLWLFPFLLACFPLLYVKRWHQEERKLTLSMAALLILSAALIQGGKGILGPIVQSLIQSAGAFGAYFRATYYFYALFALPLALLVALGLAILISEGFKNKIRIRKPFVSFLLVAIILIYSIAEAPAFTGDLAGNYVPSYPPTAYQSVNHWLESQGQGFNVLWLPPNTNTVTWNSPRITNLYFVAASSSVPTFQWFSRNILYYIYYRVYWNDTSGIGKLLSILNIKYLIFHDDVDQILGDPTAPQRVLNNLQKANSLRLVLYDPPIYVFENLDYEGSMISATNNVMYISGGPDAIAYLDSLDGFKPQSFATFVLDTAYYANVPFTPLLSNDFNSSLVFLNDFEMYNVILPMAEKYFINPVSYVNYLDNWKYWIPQDSFSFYYNYIISYNSPSAGGESFNTPAWVVDGPDAQLQSILVNFYHPESTFELPIRVNDSGNYMLFLRVFGGVNAGDLTIQLGNLTNVLSLRSQVNRGFSWAYIGKVYLERGGTHTINIKSTKGVNAFSLLALVPEHVYSELTNLLLARIENQSSRLAFITDYRGFNYSLSPMGFIPVDDSSSGNGWVLFHGSQSAAMAKIDARSTKSYIEIPYFNDFNQTRYTVSFWVMPLRNSSYNYETIITLPGIFSAYFDNDNNLWVYVPGRSAGFPVQSNNLYNVVITNDGSSLTYYINGKPLGGKWPSQPGKAIGHSLLIGLNGTYENFSPFLITNLQFYGRVLTPNEIQRLYVSGPSGQPIQSNLHLWVPLNGSNIYYTGGKVANIVAQNNIQTIILKGNNSLNVTLPIPHDGSMSFYVVARLYVANQSMPSTISLVIDGKNISQARISSNDYQVYDLGLTSLRGGTHNVSLEVEGSTAVKALFVFTSNEQFSQPASATKVVQQYASLEGERFVLNASLPMIIMYKSWYSSGMLLKVKDITLSSYASFIATNAYVVENITQPPLLAQLVYYPQVLANYGIGISIAGLLVSMLIAVYLKRKRRMMYDSSLVNTVSDS